MEHEPFVRLDKEDARAACRIENYVFIGGQAI
jgi:hypothetical protein